MSNKFFSFCRFHKALWSSYRMIKIGSITIRVTIGIKLLWVFTNYKFMPASKTQFLSQYRRPFWVFEHKRWLLFLRCSRAFHLFFSSAVFRPLTTRGRELGCEKERERVLSRWSFRPRPFALPLSLLYVPLASLPLTPSPVSLIRLASRYLARSAAR